MIFEGSLSHTKIQILSLFEYFKVTGAILPPHTRAILPLLQTGRQILVYGPEKTDLATRLTDF